MADGGMEGYEQLCRFTGDATIAGRRVRSTASASAATRGARPTGRRWPWRARWAPGSATTSASRLAIRPAGCDRHDQESVAAYVYEAGEPIRVEDPRLSTGYDGEQRQRRAGLELWLDEESPARRAAGEVVCGTSLDLGRLRLDCAFLRWHMEGREGVGRYDILRRVD